jgi:hypothetical protein
MNRPALGLSVLVSVLCLQTAQAHEGQRMWRIGVLTPNSSALGTQFTARMPFRPTCKSPPASIHGQVALTDAPFCPFFVVATPAGFTLMELKNGREVYAEGDEVIGPLYSTGRHSIELPFWNPEMVVQIEETKVPLQRAQSVYAERCFPPGVPEAVTSAK